MIERPRRPAPRTLSATPPTPSRVPQSAAYQARFPSLVAVLAGGALVPACHDVECGSTRSDELQNHGAESMRAARDGHGSQALREIGVALGVVRHTETSRIPAPGEAPVVTTTPEVTIPPPGAAPMVNPMPPPQLPIAPSGGARAVQLQPPPRPPVPPQHVTRPHPPRPDRVPVPGGIPIAQPTPPPVVPPVAPMEIQGGLRPVTDLPPARR
jgi:hypothetical protein